MLFHRGGYLVMMVLVQNRRRMDFGFRGDMFVRNQFGRRFL
jgi:hypothetical protein